MVYGGSETERMQELKYKGCWGKIVDLGIEGILSMQGLKPVTKAVYANV